MGKKGGSTTVAVDPAVGQAQLQMAQLAKEQQQWYENTIYPWMKQQTALQNQQAEDDRLFTKENAEWWKNYYQEQTAKQNARSDELYQRYQQYYKPIEDQLVAEAGKYNTAQEAQTQAQKAFDTTGSQYGQQRQALQMRMKSYGIDPTSGNYGELSRASGVNEAAAKTLAANQARQSAIELGWQKQLQLSQLGAGYLGNSLNFATGAMNAGATGANMTNNATSQALAIGQLGTQNIQNAANIGLQSYQNMQNAWGQYGNMGQQVTNYNQQVANAKAQEKASKAAGIGQAVGTAVSVAAVAL